MLGYYRAQQISDKLDSPFVILPDLNLLLVGIAFTGLMGGIYILNQIFDIETDRINDKIFFLPRGIISIRNAWIETILLYLFSIAVCLFFDLPMLINALILLIIGSGYSIPPIKFKGKPILDMLANVIMYSCAAFYAGWLVVAPFSKATLLYSLPYFFAVCAEIIQTMVPDMKGDIQNGDLTTAVWLGKKWSSILSTIMLIGTLISGIWIQDFICITTSVISLPLFLWAAISQKDRVFMISARVTGLIFVLIIGILIPYFLIFFWIIFFANRWYYRRRFDITYPAFGK